MYAPGTSNLYQLSIGMFIHPLHTYYLPITSEPHYKSSLTRMQIPPFTPHWSHHHPNHRHYLRPCHPIPMWDRSSTTSSSPLALAVPPLLLPLFEKSRPCRVGLWTWLAPHRPGCWRRSGHTARKEANVCFHFRKHSTHTRERVSSRVFIPHHRRPCSLAHATTASHSHIISLTTTNQQHSRGAGRQ